MLTLLFMEVKIELIEERIYGFLGNRKGKI